MKVATKYQVDSVRPLVEHQLSLDWPSTEQSWFQAREDANRLCDRLQLQFDHELEDPNFTDVSDSVGERMDRLCAEPAAVVKLALEYHIPSVLPAAFYMLSQISLHEDWDYRHRDEKRSDEEWRYRDEDNKLDELDRTGEPMWRGRSARWSLLDKDVLYCLMLGQNRLMVEAELWKYKVRKALEGNIESCGSRDECRRAQDYYEEFLMPDNERYPDYQGCIVQWAAEVEGNRRFCDACLKQARQLVKEAKRHLWEDLPHMFRVERLLAGAPHLLCFSFRVETHSESLDYSLDRA